MQLKWETFDDPRPRRAENGMRASIYKCGQIYLGRKAVEALGWPEAVTLMYDRRQSLIGIKAADPADPSSYRLAPKDRKTRSRILFAGSFFRRFGVRPEENLTFRQPGVDENGVLILDLNDVVPAARRRAV